MALVYNEKTGEFEQSKDLSLKQYVRKIIESSNLQRTKMRKLNKLAEDLHKIFKRQQDLNLSHGNIHHESIIITPSEDIQLIDSDNININYQHPKTRYQQITPLSIKNDHYAEFIVYLSVRAIAADLSLWSIAKNNDSTLLLTSDDYQDIHNSTTISRIKHIGGECQLLCDVLECYLNIDDIQNLEPFDILLERLTKDPVINKFSASCGKKTLNGNNIVLSWDVENYTQILLDGKDVTNQTSHSLTINSTSTYTLKLINGRKQTTKSLTISSYSSPSISVTASKNKLHKGRKESVTINWGVQNAEEITLWQDGIQVDKKCSHDDSYKCTLKDTATFTIKALALDGKSTFSDSVTVEVHPDAKFTFESDKEYAFPTIPFTLSWKTKHAKRVELNGTKVEENGTKVITKGIDKETAYTLSVTDEFGTKDKTLTIKMLPVPRITSIMVPTPDIQQTISMNVDLKMPNIAVSSLDTKLHEVDLIGAMLYDLELATIDTPQIIDLQYKLKTPTLWKRIEKTIAKILHRNENR